MEIQAPVLRRLKEPYRLETITLEEPKAGEVLVRMVASGVCHSCLSVEQGTYPDVPLPMILGDEGAGVVEAAGPGCETVRPGDHVILSWAPACGRCAPCALGRPALCENASPFTLFDGTTRFRAGDEPVMHFGPSTYSPYVVVHHSCAVPITREMPLEMAALIGCAVTTGVGAVLNTAAARPGDSVTVFGCGGIGLNAIQGAVLAGADPIVAVDVAESKLAAAERLGATVLVNARDDDAVEQVLAATHGGTDHAIVAVGSARVVEQALASLGPFGTCVLVGAPGPGDRVGVDPLAILGGERRLVGSKYGSSNPKVAFPRLVDLYLAGELKLDELVSTRYRLDQIDEASQALADGHDTRGLIVFDQPA